MQVSTVEPVVDPRLRIVEGFGLCYLIIVVRKLKVDSARVNVDFWLLEKAVDHS